MSKKRRVTSSKTRSLGLPKVLEAVSYEKATETVAVKVQLSVKNCIKRIAGKQGVSGWIRAIILEKLKGMADETN